MSIFERLAWLIAPRTTYRIVAGRLARDLRKHFEAAA
jgi:hypothetical protein